MQDERGRVLIYYNNHGKSNLQCCFSDALASGEMQLAVLLFRRTVTLEFMYVQVPKTGMQASKLNGDYHQTKFERSRVGLLSLLVTVSERFKKKKKKPMQR